VQAIAFGQAGVELDNQTMQILGSHRGMPSATGKPTADFTGILVQHRESDTPHREHGLIQI
jgi:hypothetical protein